MALKKTVSLTNNFGTDSLFPDCYIRVERMGCTKVNALVHVGFYAVKDGSALIEKTYPCELDLTGPNFITQAYLFLKTLPEFDGAVDC